VQGTRTRSLSRRQARLITLAARRDGHRHFQGTMPGRAKSGEMFAGERVPISASGGQDARDHQAGGDGSDRHDEELETTAQNLNHLTDESSTSPSPSASSKLSGASCNLTAPDSSLSVSLQEHREVSHDLRPITTLKFTPEPRIPPKIENPSPLLRGGERAKSEKCQRRMTASVCRGSWRPRDGAERNRGRSAR